jgi:predicted Fe-S protein YdhL (DUF1289 family)
MNTRPQAVCWSALPESQRRRVINRLSQLALRQLSTAGAMEGRNNARVTAALVVLPVLR